jgi:hypothetical protein
MAYSTYRPAAAALAVALIYTSRLLRQGVEPNDSVWEEAAPADTSNSPLHHQRVSINRTRFKDYTSEPHADGWEPEVVETLWIDPIPAPPASTSSSGGNGGGGGVGVETKPCLLLLVPGAPGFGVMYADLLLKVQAAQAVRYTADDEDQPRCTALAISYPDDGPQRGLDGVARHVAAALTSVLTDPQWTGGVVVLAQSMGAWFILRALVLLATSRPELVPSLVPTTTATSTKNNKRPKLRGVHLITPFFHPAGTHPQLRYLLPFAYGWIVPSLEWIMPWVVSVGRGTVHLHPHVCVCVRI